MTEQPTTGYDSDDDDAGGMAGGSDSDDDFATDDDEDNNAMDETEGAGRAGSGEAAGPSGLPGGGLSTLFTMVMAGLAGQTPHMIR